MVLYFSYPYVGPAVHTSGIRGEPDDRNNNSRWSLTLLGYYLDIHNGSDEEKELDFNRFKNLKMTLYSHNACCKINPYIWWPQSSKNKVFSFLMRCIFSVSLACVVW